MDPDDPTAAATRAVLVAYTGMWAATARAGAAPESGLDEVATFADGWALRNLTGRLTIDRAKGIHTRGRPVHRNPRVLALLPPARPRNARVRDCNDTTGWTRHDNGGRPVPDEDGHGRRQVDAIVKLGPDGRWRVTEFVLFRVGTC